MRMPAAYFCLLGMVLAVPLFVPQTAQAQNLSLSSQRTSVGGYLRVMARPELQGGTGKLGHWNLYGRLLNEGPWTAVETRFRLLDGGPVWSNLHLRLEGGSINGADASNGFLSAFFMSRAFIDTGGLLTDKGVWRLGSLIWDNGDLGLYDMRPANLFNQTVGASWRYEGDNWLVLMGLGDSGYGLKGSAYAPVITGGSMLGYTDHRHFRISVGAELRYENASPNNPNAPFNSEGIEMEPYLRGEVMEDHLFENPTQEGQELDISATDAQSHAWVLQAGFGGFGPLRWNNLFAHLERAHPTHMTTETFNGETYRLYTTGLTDQRHELMVGNEMILTLWPGRLDLIWAALYIDRWDEDNALVPSDWNSQSGSTVVRAQAFLTRTFHALFETSYAIEWSKNGNRYRNHADSIFENTAGQPDNRGLEMGDSDERRTLQFKLGPVFQPAGVGIFSRPALRLIYGAQLSTENTAWGNVYQVQDDENELFGTVESHFHQLISFEAEAWF